MANDEAVERKRKQFVDAAARGGSIGERGPADHAAQSDTVVESHRTRVELRPAMLRSAYVVHEVSDYQCARRPVNEYAFFQSKAFDTQLIDDPRKCWLRCRAVNSINAQVAALLRQARWGVQPGRWKGSGPLPIQR